MTDIEEIQQRLIAFRDERNWKQFHNLKDLALALSIEAAELNEAFLWKQPDEADKEKIAEELADVLAFALLMAHGADLDVVGILDRKIETNRLKYPVEKSHSSAKKYTEL